MATNENLIPIPGRLHSVATEGHVAGADEIYDDTLGKLQSEINQTIEPIPDNVAYLGDDEGQAVIPGFDPQTDTLHKAAQVLTTAQKDQVAQNLNNRGTANGMGRIELKATDDFKAIVEAQTGGNTVFVIKYDFTLTGDVTIPANCILEFDGGSISASGSNDTITCQSTTIISSNICFKSVTLTGTISNKDLMLAWIDSSVYSDVQMLINYGINSYKALDLCGITLFVNQPYVLDKSYEDKPYFVIKNGNIKVLTTNGAFVDTISDTLPRSTQVMFINVYFYADITERINPTDVETFIPVFKDLGIRRLNFVKCCFRGVKLIDNTTKGYLIQSLKMLNCDICDCYGTFIETSDTMYDYIFVGNNLEGWLFDFIKVGTAQKIDISNNMMESMDTLITFRYHRGISITNNYFEAIRKNLVKATGVSSNANKGFVFTGNGVYDCYAQNAVLDLIFEEDYLIEGNNFYNCPTDVIFEGETLSTSGVFKIVERKTLSPNESVTISAARGFYFISDNGNYESMLSITYGKLTKWLNTTFEGLFTIETNGNSDLIITNIASNNRTILLKKFI